MHKNITLSLILFISCFTVLAQSPQQFAYQAVVRDNNNQLVSNRTIGMRVSVLKDSTNGQSAYTETHSPKTNQQGIVQLNIGGGTVVSGSFASVPWSSGKLFVKTEIDLQGGSNYTVSGTTQLLSVPYAMYSSNVPVSKSGDTVTIGTSKLIIPGSQLISGTAPASLTNGLVAYYPFNGNANDESGNGNHGITSGVTLGNDRFEIANKAYNFNGLDNKITIPHSTSIALVGNLTISIWKKSFGNTGNYETYLTKRDANGNWNYSFGASHYFGPGGCSGELNKYVTARRNNGGSQYELKLSDSLVSTSVNRWIHIAVSIQNNNVKFYINGILTGFSCFGNQFSIQAVDVSAPMTIGSCNCGLSESFRGLLDEIRIYNRALTQDEITYLANN